MTHLQVAAAYGVDDSLWPSACTHACYQRLIQQGTILFDLVRVNAACSVNQHVAGMMLITRASTYKHQGPCLILYEAS